MIYIKLVLELLLNKENKKMILVQHIFYK